MKNKIKVESKLKVLPDHLIRAPMPKYKKPTGLSAAQKLMESSRGKKMSTREKKEAFEKAQLLEQE